VEALTAAPVLRAVLLGASNLTLALPTLVDDLRRAAGGPVEVLAACGRGRSYGAWSHLLFVRHLPGITGCGLWRAAREAAMAAAPVGSRPGRLAALPAAAGTPRTGPAAALRGGGDASPALGAAARPTRLPPDGWNHCCPLLSHRRRK